MRRFPIARTGPTALILALIGLIAGSSAGTAEELTDVGYVDQAAISNIATFRSAAVTLASYKEKLDRQFASAMRSAHGSADQQRITQTFSQQYDDKRRALLGPLLSRAQTAIASVASSKNLSIVIDKRIIITGGQDITPNVLGLLTGLAAPVQPVSTPPPSVIGFVDQTRVDALPKIKNAMSTFDSYRAKEQQSLQDRLRKTRNDTDRRGLLQTYQKQLADKQKEIIQPLLDQAQGAVAHVAGRKKLVLVVDRDDVIYGGSDVTGDVVKELGG
jgi:outer membrane protein